MNLLFENWRRYLLNEMTYAQAQKRLQAPGQQSKAIKKIIKSAAWEVSAGATGPRRGPRDPRLEADSKLILGNEDFIEVMALFYSRVLRRALENIDLDDNQKGTALTWLIALGKTDINFRGSMFGEIYQEIEDEGRRRGPGGGGPELPARLELNRLSELVQISKMDEDKIRSKFPKKASFYDTSRSGTGVSGANRGVGPWSYHEGDLVVRGDDTLATFVTRAMWAESTSYIGSGNIDSYIGEADIMEERLRPTLEKFFHYQQFMAERDLLKIKAVEKLYLITQEADDAIKKYQEKKSYADAEEGTEIFRDDGELFIAALHNKGAACHWGKETDWCTAAPGLDYFKHYYSPESPLIVIIDKEGGLTRAHRALLLGERDIKYQFHYASDQFMDSRDIPLTEDHASNIHLQIMKTDIPNKYPQIKKKFLYLFSTGDIGGDWEDVDWVMEGRGKMDMTMFLELGWKEIDNELIAHLSDFLWFRSELARQGYRENQNAAVTAYEKFISDGLKRARVDMLGVLLYLAGRQGSFGRIVVLRGLSKRVIKDNIADIIRAMPEDANYFKPFDPDNIMQFFENREFYDSLPNDLKLKFIRLIDSMAESLGDAGEEAESVSKIIKQELGVEPEDPSEWDYPEEEPREQPEEEFPEIKERWKRIAGIIL